jgi:hypothetical protein
MPRVDVRWHITALQSLSTRSPHLDPNLPTTWQSRFESGWLFCLSSPEPEARVRVVRAWWRCAGRLGRAPGLIATWSTNWGTARDVPQQRRRLNCLPACADGRGCANVAQLARWEWGRERWFCSVRGLCLLRVYSFSYKLWRVVPKTHLGINSKQH